MGAFLSLLALIAIYFAVRIIGGKADAATRKALERRGANKEDKRRRDLLG